MLVSILRNLRKVERNQEQLYFVPQMRQTRRENPLESDEEIAWNYTS